MGRSSGVRGGGSFSGDTERSSLSLVSVSLPLSSCRHEHAQGSEASITRTGLAMIYVEGGVRGQRVSKIKSVNAKAVGRWEPLVL
jgi:hypothetical protein